MFYIIIAMYKIYLFLLFITIMYVYSNSYENFNINHPIKHYKEQCPIQGTIEQIDNPTIDSCYKGYYIPYLFNVGTYISEVLT